jgi:hypothetical protein
MNKPSSKKFIAPSYIAGNVGLIILTTLALIVLAAMIIFITQRSATTKEALDPKSDGNINLLNNDNNRLSGVSKSPNISFESYLDKDSRIHINITTDKKKFSVIYNKDGSPASTRGVWLTGGTAPLDQADKESLKKLSDSFSSKLIFCSDSAVNFLFSEFLSSLTSDEPTGIDEEGFPINQDWDWPVIEKKAPDHPMGILEEVLETSEPLVFNGNCDIGLVNNDDRFFGISKSLNISFESYLDKDLVTHVSITTDKKKISGEFAKDGSLQRELTKVAYLTGGPALLDRADGELFMKLAKSLEPIFRADSAVTMNFSQFFGLLLAGDLRGDFYTSDYRKAYIEMIRELYPESVSEPVKVPPLSESDLNRGRLLLRDARRVADVKQVQLALEMYFDANHGVYPAALTSLAPTFIPMIPVDPLTAGAYKYCLAAVHMNYHLGAVLEEISNAALSNDADLAADGCASGSFNGNAAGCTGATAATPDPCYDRAP